MSLRIHTLFDQKLQHITTDNFSINKFCLCSNIKELTENVYEISITKDCIILTTEYAFLEKHELLHADKVITNNINAYDWSGNHLWNIANIVGDNGMPFWGGSVTTKELMQNYGLNEFEYDRMGELFFCTSFDNSTYIIDITNRKLLLTRKIKC